MLRAVFLITLLLTSIFGGNSTAPVADKNITLDKNSSENPNSKKLAELRAKLLKIREQRLNNEWTKTYSAYIQHKELLDRKTELEKNIFHLKSLKRLTKEQKKKLQEYSSEYKVILDKINLVKNFEKEPFKKLIMPPSLDNAPKITNPLAVIGALSYIKELQSETEKYLEKARSLENTIEALKEQRAILQEIVKLSENPIDKKHLEVLDREIKLLMTKQDILNTTKELYLKKAEEVKIAINKDIKREFEKVVRIGIIAFIFLVIFIILKFLTSRYLSNKDSYYTVNKIINIGFISVIILTLLFAYLENVSYMITILGFASAGIAIAMKDWFMSLMGWFVIVIGGSIHVGDRVKFVKDGKEYVGDVVDISLLRITIHEDVTLTTYMVNRRAGRIIFVPNNYIFTEMIANYSHSGLKTVWDGIDFFVTFDSNIHKASTIAKNIVKQYSKGYTDITRKQLNKLRSKYQLKNTNVEPRVFAFIEDFGMRISVWYLTNAYATLTLRSTISTKIIEALKSESDIEIAYPAQSIYLESGIPKPKNEDKKENKNG
jgi:small-conductance mechanosensitive channel